LPPRYPLPIDASLAAQGRKVFARECRRCHGTYQRDAAGWPIYRTPEWVSIDEVDTDTERLRIATLEYRELVSQSPAADLIQISDEYRPGYLAPRLEGIWARFPYLHNASVPNIAALLSPPEQRPDRFDLRGAGDADRFDPEQLGLTVPAPRSAEAELLTALAKRQARFVYDVRREGHSNRGHRFGTGLPEGEKRSLIEFLKTL